MPLNNNNNNDQYNVNNNIDKDNNRHNNNFNCSTLLSYALQFEINCISNLFIHSGRHTIRQTTEICNFTKLIRAAKTLGHNDPRIGLFPQP